MATIVVIPQPIRADVDEAADPHIFTEITTEPITRVEWNDAGELEVEFPGDLTDEQMNEVVRIARDEPALADLGGTVTLPPQIIPADGVTQFAQAIMDQAIIRHLQGDIAVIGRLMVARYASDTDDETTPAADSNIVELNSNAGADLFSAKAPTGEVDDDGEPLFSPLLTVPQNRWDANGNRIPAVFNGNILTDFVTVLKAFTIQGSAADGYLSHIAPSAEMVLDNAISDPDTEPLVEFGVKTTRWPGLANQFTEIGWGTHNGFAVTGRIASNADGTETLRARFIDPSTGLLDHEVEVGVDMTNWAGITAGGGHLYALGKFRASDPWSIFRCNPNGDVDGTEVGVDGLVHGPRKTALSFAGGRVLLVASDNDNDVRVHTYGTGLGHQSTDFTGINTGRRIVGTDGTYVATGGRIYHRSDPSRSYDPYAGTLTGWGQLPGGGTVATDQSGALYHYNDAHPAAATLYASWTKRDSFTGRETRQGPRAARGWPARTFATIQTGSSIGSGYNDTEIYASETGSARTQMFRVLGIPVGRTQATIAEAPTSGANPPAVNGFEGDTSGTLPGRLRSGARDGDGKPLTYLDGDGDGQFLKLMQSGTVTVTIPAADTSGHTDVTYTEPFTFAPSVTLTVASNSAEPQQVHPLTLQNETVTGFTIEAGRTGSGTADVVVNWTAIKKTQG